MKQDHRYTAPNGSTVEAYQITEASRYTQKLWPEWIDSRWFMTVDGQTWLDINGNERPLPAYAWIVNNGGAIEVVEAQDFEAYDKVVKETPLEEIAEGNVDSLFNEKPPVIRVDADMTRALVDATYESLAGIFKIGSEHGAQAAMDEIRKRLMEATHWCNCAPGECKQSGGMGCRQNSLLIER